MTQPPRGGRLTQQIGDSQGRNQARTNQISGRTRNERHPQPRKTAKTWLTGSTDGYDRFSAFVNISAASLTSNHYNIAAWDSSSPEGASLSLNSPDDGGVYVHTEGLYSVQVTLYVTASGVTSASSVIHLGVNSSELDTTPEAIWHGANEVSGFTSLPSSTVVWHLPGYGFSGGMFAQLFYPSIDAAITAVGVELKATRIR